MPVAPLLYDIRKSERKNNSNKTKTNKQFHSLPKPLKDQCLRPNFGDPVVL